MMADITSDTPDAPGAPYNGPLTVEGEAGTEAKTHGQSYQADKGENAPAIATPSSAATALSQQTTSPAASASFLQAFTDRALDFLSTASNETLGACLVGLGASTYFVLGRVGLVIIGVASGVVLHATWADIRGDDRDEATKKEEQQRRLEVGVEVAKRLMEWRTLTKPDNGPAEDTRVYAAQELDYSTLLGPQATTALNVLTDAVIKDYVHYWYDYTLPGELSFPASCRRTFMAVVLSLASHLQHQRPADCFMSFLTNASSMILVFLQELSLALNASPHTLPEEAVNAYLRMKPECSLSYMLDQTSQREKLSEIAESILQDYLDPKSYNCPPVHTFLKEVLAQLVLGYTVDMCSKPEWINDWIVYGLEESETTKEVMEIVDAGVEGRVESEVPKAVERIVEQQQSSVRSRKEGETSTLPAHTSEHKRQMSRAEEAMDEAMREARRLTELMIEDDRRRAEDEEKRRVTPALQEDSSDGATQGTPTPASSQSSQERQDEEPVTVVDSPRTADDNPITPSSQFTSFDQLVPPALPTALTDSPVKPPTRPQSVALTLHNANVSLFDDSAPGEKASLKAKPTTDFNILIEPASSAFGGWMVIRKYADFETLHEVLRRISVITGARFNESHAELPKWKTHTKSSLRSELERYICDAMKYQSLAESEGMKRFLEKEKGMSKSPGGSSKGFPWPTPDAFGKIGGDVMSALTKAPKQVAGGVAGGGKAVFGGVAGMVGGGKRANGSPTTPSRSTTATGLDRAVISEASAPSRKSTSERQTFVTDPTTGTIFDSVGSMRDSVESLRALPLSEPDDRRGSTVSSSSADTKSKISAPSSRPASMLEGYRELAQSLEDSGTGSAVQQETPDLDSEEVMNLPPPPSEMPADYGSPKSAERKTAETTTSSTMDARISSSLSRGEGPPTKPPRPQQATEPPAPPKEPITERETSVAVELIFAIISELFTLSGAWGIRKTLLHAAKTFLLRPGNPQLLSIRDLLQTSLLDSNTNDAGLAHHIYKLRQNTLPTAEELETWKRDYPEKTAEQKEELRIKARKLLVSKGMPQALTSVMGTVASGEALGKVFDCLQVPEISRALIFGLMVQAMKVVVQ